LSVPSYATFLTAKQAEKESNKNSSYMAKQIKFDFFKEAEYEIEEAIDGGRNSTGYTLLVSDQERPFLKELSEKLKKLGYRIDHEGIYIIVSW
jgi:D-alanyl-D-alanine carboxypeptidase